MVISQVFSNLVNSVCLLYHFTGGKKKSWVFIEQNYELQGEKKPNRNNKPKQQNKSRKNMHICYLKCNNNFFNRKYCGMYFLIEFWIQLFWILYDFFSFFKWDITEHSGEKFCLSPDGGLHTPEKNPPICTQLPWCKKYLHKFEIKQ